jgi:hypothetical protein
MAVDYDTTINQGADWYINFQYKDTATNTPINITGYTAALQLRSLPSDTTTALSLTSPSGGITITGATGLVEVHATAVQTGAIVTGYYYYDCEITSPTNVVTRLIQGQILVSPQVTR